MDETLEKLNTLLAQLKNGGVDSIQRRAQLVDQRHALEESARIYAAAEDMDEEIVMASLDALWDARIGTFTGELADQKRISAEVLIDMYTVAKSIHAGPGSTVALATDAQRTARALVIQRLSAGIQPKLAKSIAESAGDLVGQMQKRYSP